MRRGFRWCRIAAWFAILTLIAAYCHLCTSGLPSFARAWITTELRSRGLELDAPRIRMRWTGGVVAEDVSLRTTDAAPVSARFAEVRFDLDTSALWQRQLRLEALHLNRGRLAVDIHQPQDPPRQIQATDLRAVLRFPPGDILEFDQFEATAFGARLLFSASITNVSRIARSSTSAPPRTASPPGPLVSPALQARLRAFADTVEAMTFDQPPEIRLMVQADALRPSEGVARLNFHAPEATTRWGRTDNLMLTLQWAQPSQPSDDATPTNRHSSLRLESRRIEADAGIVQQLLFEAHGHSEPGSLWPNDMTWTASANTVTSRWLVANSLRLRGTSRQNPSSNAWWTTQIEMLPGHLQTPWASGNADILAVTAHHTTRTPLHWHASLTTALAHAESAWGQAQQLRLEASLNHPGTAAAGSDRPDWHRWNLLRPFDAAWSIEATHLAAQGVTAERIETRGTWQAPLLRIERARGSLYDGGFDLEANLDVNTRQVEARGDVHFDIQQLAPLLGPAGRKWLSQFGWQQPPQVQASIAFTLPPWTNSNLNWKRDVEPTMQLAGKFEVGAGSFRGVPLLSARSSLQFTNGAWRLPDLYATRPEGSVSLDYWCHGATQDYWWVIASAIDPRCLKPLLEPGAQRALDSFVFTNAPTLEGRIWGRWQAPDRVGFTGTARGSNFVFRGESVAGFSASLQYTNQLLWVQDVILDHATGRGTLPGAFFDIPAASLHLTNGFSTLDPLVVARMIGPLTAAAIEPYRFANPPRILVNGTVRIGDESKNDLRFEVEGGPFSYWRFNLPQTSAQLHWQGDSLSISNLQGEFYGGHVNAGFLFNFQPDTGSEFSLKARIASVNLNALLKDLLSPTNRLEGLLEGEVEVTSARSSDWYSWNGSGRASLRDGYLWSLPVLGVLSQPLDAILPGVGSQRFSSGAATFTMTNSVLWTRDLSLDSSAIRLDYTGSVDFDANVNARVEAQILRGLGPLGQVFGVALLPLTKLLEYRVTGTLGKPEAELIHIPKLLLLPLQPLRMIRGLFQDDKKDPPPAP